MTENLTEWIAIIISILSLLISFFVMTKNYKFQQEQMNELPGKLMVEPISSQDVRAQHLSKSFCRTITQL